MAKSTFLNSNINLQNTRNLSLSDHIPEISFSIRDTYILQRLLESTFVFFFLKEGFIPNLPSFRFLSVLSSDVSVLYGKKSFFNFFFFMGMLHHSTTITVLISPVLI